MDHAIEEKKKRVGLTSMNTKEILSEVRQSITHSCRLPTVNPKKKISNIGPKWVDDKTVKACTACGFQFNVIVRRHHCRACGNVFCRYCSQERWQLPRFDYHSPVRVCVECGIMCEKAVKLQGAINNNDVEEVGRLVRGGYFDLYVGIYPPLTLAAAEGFPEICRVLICGKADVNHAVSAVGGRSWGEHVGVTALHAVCRSEGPTRFKAVYNTVEVVRLLTNAGAQVNARTAGGDTALHLAAANGHADCCELLLGLSADVNAIAGGNTPLHNAVRCDKAAGGDAGAPATSSVTSSSCVHVVSLLLRAGAQKDLKNLENMTPLQLAQRLHRSEAIAALLSVEPPAPPPPATRTPAPPPPPTHTHTLPLPTVTAAATAKEASAAATPLPDHLLALPNRDRGGGGGAVGPFDWLPCKACACQWGEFAGYGWPRRLGACCRYPQAAQGKGRRKCGRSRCGIEFVKLGP